MDEKRKMTRMTISMDEETKKRLKAAAYERRTTPSALIQQFIWSGLVLKTDEIRNSIALPLRMIRVLLREDCRDMR